MTRLTRKIRVDGPIVVYQMGRVGSASVYQSLRRLRLSVPVYHTHILNGLDNFVQNAKAEFEDPSAPLAEFENALRVRKELRRDPERRWNVVSLVRDPIRQALSAFFHGLPSLVPDARDRWRKDKLDSDEITAMFLARHNHNAAVQWFDTQLRDVFDVDVYERPFPTERGFDVFRGSRASLLMLRCEDMDACATEAFKEFLGLTRIRLRRVNQAEEHWYADMYRQYLSEAALPPAYIDRMYSSKVAIHFYRPAELEAFRSQWTLSR